MGVPIAERPTQAHGISIAYEAHGHGWGVLGEGAMDTTVPPMALLLKFTAEARAS